jgi:CheY-like chemotaxis protein
MLNKTEILNAGILIVDDKQANVKLLEDMLHQAGYLNISSTTDPYAVAALHRDKNFDLILLDLQMPGMDGFEVMEKLTQSQPNGYVPILVITAQPDHKLRALSCGAKDFMAKPFDLVEVKTRIHNMLEVRLLYKKLENYNKTLEQAVLDRTAELKDSEERFRRFTELSSDCYWEQDVDGQFTTVYGPVLEMLDISSPNMPGKIKPEQTGTWNGAERSVLKGYIADRRPFLDFVFSFSNAVGKLQYFQVSGEPKFDGAGGFAGYRGVGRDATKSMSEGAQKKAG